MESHAGFLQLRVCSTDPPKYIYFKCFHSYPYVACRGNAHGGGKHTDIYAVWLEIIVTLTSIVFQVGLGHKKRIITIFPDVFSLPTFF